MNKYVTRTSAGEGGKLTLGAVLASSWKLLKEQDPSTHHQKTSCIYSFIFVKLFMHNVQTAGLMGLIGLRMAFIKNTATKWWHSCVNICILTEIQINSTQCITRSWTFVLSTARFKVECIKSTFLNTFLLSLVHFKWSCGVRNQFWKVEIFHAVSHLL